MKTGPLYQEITKLFQRRHNLWNRMACDAASSDRKEAMIDQISAEITRLSKQYLPSGSGFNVGTLIDEPLGMERGYIQRLVFNTAFHHLDENGYYDRWTEHKVMVMPDLAGGIFIKVSGQNYRDIKEYIADQFHAALTQVVAVAPCLGEDENEPLVLQI